MSAEPFDLRQVERAVRTAVARRDPNVLMLVGHGEVSMVIGWPTERPAMALKRVAPFAAASSADGYLAACQQFFELMDQRGVAVLPTTLHTLHRDDGSVVVYHQQPLVDGAAIGSQVLRNAAPADRHPLLDAVVDAAARAITPTVGLDCQVSNWHWDGEVATQLDVTSPFLLDTDRRDMVYDSRSFAGEYPWVTRAYLKRELLKVVRRFTTIEGALSDMVANLLKEDLGHWVQPAIDTIHDRLGVTVDRASCQKMYDVDRRLFLVALRLKKTQRGWMRVTRRPYETLLPERTTYAR